VIQKNDRGKGGKRRASSKRTTAKTKSMQINLMND
jgi:hypothetical protein